jgi:protease I
MAERKLAGKKVAILAADMFERVELEEPRQALEDAGATTEVISIHDGEIQGFDHFDPANKVKVDRTVEEVSVDDYDALLIPGGVGNPDQLRGDENAVGFVRAFADAGKPMAVICHGPWMLVESGVVRGKRVTSWPTLETDIRNAGGEWVDEEVVVDGNLITSRNPGDLPAFNKAILDALS